MKAVSLKVILILPLFVPLALFSGCAKEKTEEETIMPQEVLQQAQERPLGKKAAMIIAFEDFRDEEYFVPKEVLEKAGVTVTTASNQLGSARGAGGGETQVDVLASQLKVEDYQAIVFIGGPGCLKNLDNQTSCQITQEAIRQNKILAAICISPVILAKAGALEGKKATVWSSALDKSAVKTLQEKGAIYQDERVMVDGNIITANGPAAAQAFGQNIAEALKD